MTLLLDAHSVLVQPHAVLRTPPQPLDRLTESLRLSIARPPASGATWDADTRLRIAICVSDGRTVHKAETRSLGGVIDRSLEISRGRQSATPESTKLSYSLPVGHFGVDGFARRIGELSRLQVWVELEILSGSSVDTTVTLSDIRRLAPAVQRHHSVAFDAASCASQGDTSGDDSISVSHAAGSGDNRGAFVACWGDTSAGATMTATYDGNSLTQDGNNSGPYNEQMSAIFHALDSEMGSGSVTVEATFSSDPDIDAHIGVVSVEGMDQYEPTEGIQWDEAFDGTSPSVTVSGVGDSSLVVDFLGFWCDTPYPGFTAGADQTERDESDHDSSIYSGATAGILVSTQAGSDGGVMSWTKPTNYEYVIGAIELLAQSPQPLSVTETQFSSAVTDHDVDLPATIDSGDLLMLICTMGDGISSTPSGWTEVYLENMTGFAAYGACYVRKADGTEDGGTVTITTDSAVTGAAQVWRIIDWGGNVNDIDYTSVASAVSASTNPPSHTPTYGEYPTLWVAAAHAFDDDATISTYPTSYSGTTDTVSGGGANNGATVGSAWRKLDAASENPTSFQFSESEVCFSATIAIPPAGVDTGFTGECGLEEGTGETLTCSGNFGAGFTGECGLEEGTGETLQCQLIRGVTLEVGSPDMNEGLGETFQCSTTGGASLTCGIEEGLGEIAQCSEIHGHDALTCGLEEGLGEPLAGSGFFGAGVDLTCGQVEGIGEEAQCSIAAGHSFTCDLEEGLGETAQCFEVHGHDALTCGLEEGLGEPLQCSLITGDSIPFIGTCGLEEGIGATLQCSIAAGHNLSCGADEGLGEVAFCSIAVGQELTCGLETGIGILLQCTFNPVETMVCDIFLTISASVPVELSIKESTDIEFRIAEHS